MRFLLFSVCRCFVISSRFSSFLCSDLLYLRWCRFGFRRRHLSDVLYLRKKKKLLNISNIYGCLNSIDLLVRWVFGSHKLEMKIKFLFKFCRIFVFFFFCHIGAHIPTYIINISLFVFFLTNIRNRLVQLVLYIVRLVFYMETFLCREKKNKFWFKNKIKCSKVFQILTVVFDEFNLSKKNI